jgi:hypothetical protein
VTAQHQRPHTRFAHPISELFSAERIDDVTFRYVIAFHMLSYSLPGIAMPQQCTKIAYMKKRLAIIGDLYAKLMIVEFERG